MASRAEGAGGAVGGAGDAPLEVVLGVVGLAVDAGDEATGVGAAAVVVDAAGDGEPLVQGVGITLDTTRMASAAPTMMAEIRAGTTGKPFLFSCTERRTVGAPLGS